MRKRLNCSYTKWMFSKTKTNVWLQAQKLRKAQIWKWKLKENCRFVAFLRSNQLFDARLPNVKSSKPPCGLSLGCSFTKTVQDCMCMYRAPTPVIATTDWPFLSHVWFPPPPKKNDQSCAVKWKTKRELLRSWFVPIWDETTTFWSVLTLLQFSMCKFVLWSERPTQHFVPLGALPLCSMFCCPIKKSHFLLDECGKYRLRARVPTSVWSRHGDLISLENRKTTNIPPWVSVYKSCCRSFFQLVFVVFTWSMQLKFPAQRQHPRQKWVEFWRTIWPFRCAHSIYRRVAAMYNVAAVKEMNRVKE